MRAAVISGDQYHPTEIVKQGIEALNRSDTDWDFVPDTLNWSMENFNRYDLILLAKGNSRSVEVREPWLTDEIQQGFVDFVDRGKSLFVVHSGTVGYLEEPVFRSLVGGGFAHHPPQSNVTVEWTDPPALAMEASDPYTVWDEHYLMKMFGDDHRLFLKSKSDHGVEPAGWLRRQGMGEVCVLTPGHNLEVWLHPEFQRTLSSALNYLTRNGTYDRG